MSNKEFSPVSLWDRCRIGRPLRFTPSPFSVASPLHSGRAGLREQLFICAYDAMHMGEKRCICWGFGRGSQEQPLFLMKRATGRRDGSASTALLCLVRAPNRQTHAPGHPVTVSHHGVIRLLASGALLQPAGELFAFHMA